MAPPLNQRTRVSPKHTTPSKRGTNASLAQGEKGEKASSLSKDALAPIEPKEATSTSKSENDRARPRSLPPTLAIVVPCYNEEAVLPLTAPRFDAKLQELEDQGLCAPDSFVLYVDDGSTDATWTIIRALSRQTPRAKGARLSRNRGHQNALVGGLMEARAHADVTISIDADGQDDLNAMNAMLEAYKDGYELVYGVRNDRSTDTLFKRATAQTYYKLLSLLGAEVIYNAADYRLASSEVLNEFAEFEEVNLYLRGLFPLVGFPSTTVEYARSERLAGTSHYPLSKMLGLAFDGITSLSVRPLQIITLVGLVISIVSFVGVIWCVVTAALGNAVAGWASTTAILCFMSGVQLLSLGVIGTYVGKTYLETKARPRYIISERTGYGPKSDS